MKCVWQVDLDKDNVARSLYWICIISDVNLEVELYVERQKVPSHIIWLNSKGFYKNLDIELSVVYDGWSNY